MNAGLVFIGDLPDGTPVHAQETTVAQVGLDKLRYELVDREWFKSTGSAPGYFPVCVDWRKDHDVMVKAESHEAAIRKYFSKEQAK